MSPQDRLPQAPTAATTGGLAARVVSNLEQRIASGLVMIVVAVGLVYAGTLPFAGLVLAIALVMSWEWGHLVRGAAHDGVFVMHAGAVAVAVALAACGYPVLALSAVLAGAAIVVPLAVDRRARLSGAGVLYAGLAAVAILWLRHDEPLGFAAVVFICLVVWSTDTMAFVFGRAIGGAKLWSAVSPNKTWAGFLGGVGSSFVLSAVYGLCIPEASALRLGLLGLCLGIVAQGGDLAESALKRSFGAKDASHIIPGHGGVMDRMDGFVAAAVAAALFALVTNGRAPATALLTGG